MIDFIIDTLLVSILGVAAAAYLTFVFLYDRMFPWRGSFQGRTLVAQKITLASLAVFFIVDRFTLTGLWRDAVLVVILAALAGQAIATLVGLIRIYRARAAKSKEDS